MGVSLVEVLVSITVLGTASLLYGAAWSSHVTRQEAIREQQTATLLLLRQVEILRGQNPRAAGAPFTESDYLPDTLCPPFSYNDSGSDLDPPVAKEATLTDANSFVIPAGHPWLIDLGALAGQGYSLRVRAARIRDSPDPAVLKEDRLIKYGVQVDRTVDGSLRTLVVAEFLREVR